MFSENRLKTSVNQIGDLPKGKYNGRLREYINLENGQFYAYLEFFFENDQEPSVCEIYIYDDVGTDNESFVPIDFMKLIDGSWRNSYGERNDLLLELLPRNIINATFIKESNLLPVEIF